MVGPLRLWSFNELSSFKRGPDSGPLIEVGVFGLQALAWELAPAGRGIAAPASGFHREGDSL